MPTTSSTSASRVGLYAWAGPGTIRLLQTKYHNPKIDRESFLSLYEPKYLDRAKQLFGVTDMWVTFSWGFSDVTETEDRAYIVSRLSHFKARKIRAHAYVQGFNVVTNEFANQDLFCTDPKGKRLPYSHGRSFICPNNPNASALILSRVRQAAKLPFDGIFVDNLLFGLPPLSISQDYASFFGCSCKYCQQAFQIQLGYPLPLYEKREQALRDYLTFRSHTTTRLIRSCYTIAHRHHKEFGINLYDPYQHNASVFYGYNLSSIQSYLDYNLIENHNLPGRKKNNTHLLPLLQAQDKPVFVVSYQSGIGFEKQFNQSQIDAIFSESQQLAYAPCLKATEFTTKGIWHTLQLDQLRTPTFHPMKLKVKHKAMTLKKSSPLQRLLINKVQRYYSDFLRFFFENQSTYQAVVFFGIYQRQLKKWKNFEF